MHQSTPSFPTALPPQPATLFITITHDTPSPRQPLPPTLSLLCTHTHTYSRPLATTHDYTTTSEQLQPGTPARLQSLRAYVPSLRASHCIAPASPLPASALASHTYSRPAFTRRPQRSFLESLGLASCGSDTFTVLTVSTPRTRPFTGAPATGNTKRPL